MEKKFTKIILSVLSVLMVIMLFAACDMDPAGALLLSGTWTDDYGSKILVTDDTYANYYGDELNYSGEIVDYSNNSFNVDETSDYDDYGYILVTLTESNSDWTPVGTCFVLRWENMVTTDGVTAVSMSEGYGDETFTTTDEALAGMTAEDGYFNWYSSYTLSEE